MKIHNIDDIRTKLQLMFQYKWSCLNQLLVPSIIEDVIKFIEQYDNRRGTNV